MASKTQMSLFSLVFLLAISGEVLAGRQILKDSKNVDVKQPDFLNSDGSFLIPGIGRVLIPPTASIPYIPPATSIPSYDPHTGIGSSIPGGDDTFLPIPEGGVPTVNHP
ncbi:unnamed protein product [Dovyalis caffra]|uniref:Cell wall protein n=1 Tax=Dovyalis caffra TaxID=77055 RepID=A0AAV1SJ22_9ROSI|nr:unnamed protein product [Dovyalis caffra]